jgi:hypothetical protein
MTLLRTYSSPFALHLFAYTHLEERHNLLLYETEHEPQSVLHLVTVYLISCQYIRIYSTKRQDNQWTMNGKGCGRKRLFQHFPTGSEESHRRLSISRSKIDPVISWIESTRTWCLAHFLSTCGFANSEFQVLNYFPCVFNFANCGICFYVSLYLTYFPYFEKIKVGYEITLLSVCIPSPTVARQRFGKHIPAATNTHETIE